MKRSSRERRVLIPLNAVSRYERTVGLSISTSVTDLRGPQRSEPSFRARNPMKPTDGVIHKHRLRAYSRDSRSVKFRMSDVLVRLVANKFSMRKAGRSVLVASIAAGCGSVISAPGDLGGNRFLLERYYASEISVAQTFLEAVVKKERRNRDEKLTIIDVRDATEYRSGHPDGAHHVPYPRIYQACATNPANAADAVLRTEDGGVCRYGVVPASTVAMNPERFFLTVEALFPDKSERLAMLCRTGLRGVRAGNILANPEKYLGPGYGGRGYSRVSNVWQGFVGLPMAPVNLATGFVMGVAPTTATVTLDNGTSAFGFSAMKLDMNNDAIVDARDNDGWRYHQGLPFETKLHRHLLNIDSFPYYTQP
jgi:rhodanese-related sulfurtransferase